MIFDNISFNFGISILLSVFLFPPNLLPSRLYICLQLNNSSCASRTDNNGTIGTITAQIMVEGLLSINDIDLTMAFDFQCFILV